MNKAIIRAIILSLYTMGIIGTLLFFMIRERGQFFIQWWSDNSFVYMLYIALALLFVGNTVIIIVLYRRTLGPHDFFFVAAVNSSIPLIITRAYFFFLPLIQGVLKHDFSFYARLYSGFYIAMTLFWFLSILFTGADNNRYSIIMFLCALAVAAKISSIAPVIQEGNNLPGLYVGGTEVFLFACGFMYLIILILFFFDRARANTKKRIAFYQFFIIMLIIVSMQMLLFTETKLVALITGGVLMVSVLAYMRGYFIRTV